MSIDVRAGVGGGDGGAAGGPEDAGATGALPRGLTVRERHWR